MAKCFESLMFWKRNNNLRGIQDHFSDDEDSVVDNYSSVYDKEMELVSKFGPDDSHIENLKRIMPTSLETLGAGAFSVVKKCYSEKYANFVAVKIIKLNEENNRSYVEKFLPIEIKLWSKLSSEKHVNILNLLEALVFDNFQYLVTEMAEKGDVNDFLHYGTINEYKAKNMFRDIASAIHFCHGMGIAHRDIKPENILITGAGHLKLADFSFVTDENPVIWERCGTPRMLAPEQTTLASYDPFKSDIWQVGLTLYVMIFKIYPFESTRKNDIFNELKAAKNVYNNVPFPKSKMVSADLKNLISDMLNLDPVLRISAKDVVKSTWLVT